MPTPYTSLKTDDDRTRELAWQAIHARVLERTGELKVETRLRRASVEDYRFGAALFNGKAVEVK